MLRPYYALLQGIIKHDYMRRPYVTLLQGIIKHDRMRRPYPRSGERFVLVNPHNLMHMVGHDDEFIHPNIGEMRRQCIPNILHDLANRRKD